MKKRERILVVDDDGPSREVMVEVLTDAGYTVEAAADGYEALWIVARRRPDLIISDLSMPGLNGLELTRRLHAFAGKIPVVLTTGLADTRDVVTSAEEYGAVACLPKPMNLDELVWTIDRTLACIPVAAVAAQAG